MLTPMHCRYRRLSGVMSLLDLALGAWSSDMTGSRLPTSARLRRDIGLPEIEDVAASPAMPRRRI